MHRIETADIADSKRFAEVCAAALGAGAHVRFQAHGQSMQPNVLDRDVVEIAPAEERKLRRGDIVLARMGEKLLLHRVVRRDPTTGGVVTRGDVGLADDAPADVVLGSAISVQRGRRKILLTGNRSARLYGPRIHARRIRRALAVRAQLWRSLLAPALFLLIGGVFGAPVAQAQFTLTNKAAPANVAPGGTITFTQVLTATRNFTPSSRRVANITQTIPANATYTGYSVNDNSGGNWTCTPAAPIAAGGTLTCTDTAGAYRNGTTTTFTITMTVAAGTANGTVITDTLNSNDATSASASSTVVVSTGNVDLSMTQTESPNPVATGAQITYAETVTNNDPTLGAAGASLTQSTPANTTFVSATAPAGWTCGTVPAVGGTGTITCTANGEISPNTTSGNFAMVVAVNAAAAVHSNITNAATLTETGGADPNLANNTTTTATTVSGADLSMTQSVSPTAVAPGAQITYTEIVMNNGPDAAVGAVLYQETPTNTTFLSITAPAGWNCGTQPAPGGTGQVICTATGNISPSSGPNTCGANACYIFTYVVTVSAATAAGTTVTNAADVTAQTTDSVPSNNASIASALVENSVQSDLSVSMTAAPTPVFVSSTLTYTIQVQNLGLAAASNVTVTDTLPASLTNASAIASQGSCAPPSGGQIVCTLGTVAYPLGAPIVITVTGTSPGTATTLTHTATVGQSGTDPVTVNNTATVLTVVQPLVCATPGKDGTPGAPLSGVVNTYYAGVGTASAGSTTITVGTPSSGSSTQIGAGDLLLVIQMQDATINSSNTSSYGDGVPGDPASGSTSLGSSGEFEFVTVSNVTVNANTDTLTIVGTGANGGLLNAYVTSAATNTQGAETFQIIRVPQYSSATLSSSLAALPWNGSVGGVLVLDVASQLTLGGTVSLDGNGFRGGGGRILGGAVGLLGTDDVTLSTLSANGSKGEGIAGTPHYVAPALNAITPATTATSTAQPFLEGLLNGSYARGAPGNAGGGATDADPIANDQNSGGGGGGNGGTGGTGGFGWNSAGVVGGFGGVGFPATTGAVVMGGGGGAGTTNNGSWWDPTTNTGNANCGANCTGVYSSGTAGGGIVIIRAGSVTGTGTITSSGQNALDEENDGGGGGGAGGSVLVYANSGPLTGLTVYADGGNGAATWPEVAPGAFPGNRHGPGAGGGGGVIFTSSVPAYEEVKGGQPGTSTLADDAYGATAGQPGLFQFAETVTETPGTQSGAYCAGADLAMTNSAAPNPVVAGGNITYTQQVTNAGPQDAVNATLNEPIPANTTFQSIAITGADATGWSCTTPAVNGTGTISCTNADVPPGANGTATFTVTVNVNPGTASGTQIADTVSVASGTNDPNLANNSATAMVVVAAANSADLNVTNAGSPNPVIAGQTVTYTVVVNNPGPVAAASAILTDSFTCVPSSGPAFNCITGITTTPWPSGWTCGAVSGTQFTCSGPASMAANSSATFAFQLTVNSTTASGTLIEDTATVSSSTADPNPSNNLATATVVVATAGQADLGVTKTGTPNPVLAGNVITYTITVTDNGPAASVNAQMTDTLPANATFVSIVASPPGTWSCSGPAAGAETCTDATLAVGAAGTTTFTLKMQVNPGAPSGTVITNTATVSESATTADPYSANNTATTSSVVASPTQADVAIVKTAAPEPVEPGTTLTYTLQVTNNGPAVAQNLVVTDPLPSQVTFVSASIPSSEGTCQPPSAGPPVTITCNVPSLNVGGLAIITIVTTAESSGTPAAATNTATVTCTAPCPGDPNLTNNSSTVISTITSPTAVGLDSFQAQARPGGGVLITWRTREETRNLGFHVYRDDATGKHQLDPSLIAGSALFFRGGLPQHHARTYAWIDPQGNTSASYWLEDVDLNGTTTMHGPVYAEGNAQAASPAAQSRLLTQLNQAIAPMPTHVLRASVTPAAPLPWSFPATGVSLDVRPAVKISVSAEGWYQVTGAQLYAAGLPANANVRTLQLYAEGVEQPLIILGARGGVLGASDAIEFYGTGIDTPYSGTRVYWLIQGWRPGQRISSISAGGSGAPSATSFPFTALFQQRTTYFAALLNGENNDNFFGAIVTTTPVDQVLTIAHLDPNSTVPTTLSVTLQGVTQGEEHRVDVSLNGVPLGEMDFAGQASTSLTFPVNAGIVQNGSNTVTLAALDGDNDVSLVQSIELNYAHAYSADSDWLRATAQAGETIRIDGFTQPSVEVFDITNPTAIARLNAPVTTDGSSYGVTIAVDGAAGSQRTLLALAGDQISAPDALAYHAPSTLAENTAGANYVVVSHPDFVSGIASLVKLHESMGESVAVVTSDQIYDAYNYGEHSPFALRDFLQFAATKWRVKPSAVLLVGDASFDPRNYLGFGDFDFVPTRMIETAAFKTASDDWLTDFNQSGFATISTGRLPVRTPDEAASLVSKIVDYETGASAGTWQNQAVVIADQNIDADFTSAANAAAATLPPSLQVTKVLADGEDSSVAQQQILAALNSGALLVNYSGHGSEEQWSFADLFDGSTAAALSNGNRLPMYLLMDCLNGFFQDVYATSLSTSLMLAPNGGAVAVWASSGFTDAAPQATMDQAFLSAWAANPQVPIGTAILAAKLGITDADVRRTWILFGDPEMRLKMPAPAATQSSLPAPTHINIRRPTLR